MIPVDFFMEANGDLVWLVDDDDDIDNIYGMKRFRKNAVKEDKVDGDH